MTALKAGSRLGRYRIEAVIGRGGMGVVYRAMQDDLDRQVALKVIAAHLAEDECGVAASWVGPELDVVVDRACELDAGLPFAAVEELDLHATPEALHQGLMLLCQGWCGVGVLEVGEEEGVEASCEGAHDEASDLAGGLALGGAFGDVGAGLGVVDHALVAAIGDDGHVLR